MHTTTKSSLLVIALFAGSLGLGLLTGQAAAGRAKDPYAKLGVFARVFTIIEHSYVEEVSEDELLDAAIDGMVDHLDKHTRWLDETEFQSLRDETAGRYEGIGVEVRTHAEGATVLRVIPGGPAHRDGMLAMDVIIEANGTALAGMDLSTLSQHLQGKRGTPVELRVRRPDVAEPLLIRTIRDRIEIAAVERAELPGGVAYIRLRSFQSDSADDVERAIKQLRSDGAKQGVILDLRDNPGGLLDEAVQLVDLFVDEGPIVSTRGRMEGEQIHEASNGGFGLDLPLVVLTNGMSASASEVVVGALQDTGRATIVGTHTYGKGSVQTLFGVPDTQEGLKLTIARYHTPSGEPVAAGEGRKPDRLVHYAPDEVTPLAALQAGLRDAEGLPEEERTRLLALSQNLEDTEVEPADIPWNDPITDRWRTDPQVVAAMDELGVKLPPAE